MISLILALTLMFSMSSCNFSISSGTDDSAQSTSSKPGTTPSTDPDSIQPVVGRDVAFYRDTVFYYDQYKHNIKFQNIAYVLETGLPLYQDPLSTSAEDPFSKISSTKIIVDPVATENNKGQPVLYLYTERNGTGSDTKKQLISFDTATNRIRVLKDGLDNVKDLVLYGDTLFFSVFEADGEDLKYKLHAIKTDGSGLRTFDNPDNLILGIATVWNHQLYFVGSGNLYTAPRSLDSYSLFMPEASAPIVFCDGYLYYSPRVSNDLWRAPLDDLSAKELVHENGRGMAQNGLIISRGRSDENKFNDISVYDPKTNEKVLVYQKDADVTVMYQSFSKTYIVFDVSGDHALIYYDIDSQEEITIPY